MTSTPSRCKDPDNLVWLSQTTLSVDETMETVRRLRERFPNLQDPPSDDICYATQNRQVAIKKVAEEAELVIVVGSANSSNTVRLVDVALETVRRPPTASTTRARSGRSGSTVSPRSA
jgi:4-hydroxy-3-methylbut-2-enyl diphosphate reductase